MLISSSRAGPRKLVLRSAEPYAWRRAVHSLLPPTDEAPVALSGDRANQARGATPTAVDGRFTRMG